MMSLFYSREVKKHFYAKLWYHYNLVRAIQIKCLESAEEMDLNIFDTTKIV